MFDSLIGRGYQVEYQSHARAILSVDFPDAVAELEQAIAEATIPTRKLSRAAVARPRAPSDCDGL